MNMKGSHTLLACYQNCNHQAFRRYVAKDVPYVETPQMAWGNDVHDQMDKRLSSGKPLTGEVAKYEGFAAALAPMMPLTEVRLGVRANWEPCGFYDADCYFCCKIDVLIVRDGTAAIFDWKTGKRREDPTELRQQGSLVLAHNPGLRRIVGRYVWLQDNALGVEHDLLSFVRQTDAEIVSMMAHLRASAGVNHWPKRQGPLCAYCNVPDCEFLRKPN